MAPSTRGTVSIARAPMDRGLLVDRVQDERKPREERRPRRGLPCSGFARLPVESGDRDAAFAAHGVQQVELALVFEDERVAQLTHQRMSGAERGWGHAL